MKEATKINPPERSRVYRFKDGQLVTIDGVCEISVSASGNHRLKTINGKLHIVPPNWAHIEIDADDWSL